MSWSPSRVGRMPNACNMYRSPSFAAASEHPIAVIIWSPPNCPLIVLHVVAALKPFSVMSRKRGCSTANVSPSTASDTNRQLLIEGAADARVRSVATSRHDRDHSSRENRHSPHGRQTYHTAEGFPRQAHGSNAGPTACADHDQRSEHHRQVVTPRRCTSPWRRRRSPTRHIGRSPLLIAVRDNAPLDPPRGTHISGVLPWVVGLCTRRIIPVVGQCADPPGTAVERSFLSSRIWSVGCGWCRVLRFSTANRHVTSVTWMCPLSTVPYHCVQPRTTAYRTVVSDLVCGVLSGE